MAKETMTKNEEKLEKRIAEDYKNVLREAKSMNCNSIRALYNIPIKSFEIIVKALEDIQQYRAIGTPEECRAAVEKQTETLTVDKAKTIAAKAICVGCGYLADCKCDYNGGNCMVSKPMLESVLKSFDDWNRRADNGKAD